YARRKLWFQPRQSFFHYFVTGRRVTERRDADASLSPPPAAEAVERFLSSGAPASPILFCHQMAIELAMAVVEYGPAILPTKSASENPRRTSPPNRTSASTERNTSPLVTIVRDIVWLIESFVSE